MPRKCINAVESKEETSDLWSAIEEISKLRSECMCYLICVQIENLKIVMEEENNQRDLISVFTASEIFDRVLREFETIKDDNTQEKNVDGKSKNLDVNVIEAIWSLVIECRSDSIKQYKAYFKQIIAAVCNFKDMLSQFMTMEALVVQVFQQCFTKDKKVIIFYLMENLFKRIQFTEDEDNFNSELRKKVFHCLRKYTETIHNCFTINESIFARKVFSFIIRFYILLVEERGISSFEELFETKCRLCHQEILFNVKV